jgi:outer membrane protein assembly factor BamB
MKTMTAACLGILAGWAAFGTGHPAAAGESWQQWRGPSRNGVLAAEDAPATWPAQLTKGWTAAVGEGYSSPIASDTRVFVHARRDPDETVSAIDLATGAVAWTRTYPAPTEKNPYAKTMAKGPYATPLLAGGRLFTLGTTAILTAWNATTGALVWRRDFSARIDTSKLFCGTAMSPLMTRHGIVIHVGDDRGGAIMTLDPATGKDKWTTAVAGPGYASPVELTLAGAPQIVTLTTKSVIGVDTLSGALLWEFPFNDEWNENIVTPIVMPDGVIVSGVRQGTRRLIVARAGAESGAAFEVKAKWHTPDVTMYMSSPVLTRGTIFGHSTRRKGQFVAIDPESGSVRWSTEGRNASSAAVVAAGGNLVFLTTEGQLIVSPIDPAKFDEQRKYPVADSATYAHPIVLRDRVIVRDQSALTEWKIR